MDEPKRAGEKCRQACGQHLAATEQGGGAKATAAAVRPPPWPCPGLYNLTKAKHGRKRGLSGAGGSESFLCAVMIGCRFWRACIA